MNRNSNVLEDFVFCGSSTPKEYLTALVHVRRSQTRQNTNAFFFFLRPHLRLGYQDGAPPVAVQGTVRQKEEGAVCRTSQSVQRGLEDCVQCRPQCGGLAQDGALLLWPGLPDAAL